MGNFVSCSYGDDFFTFAVTMKTSTFIYSSLIQHSCKMKSIRQKEKKQSSKSLSMLLSKQLQGLHFVTEDCIFLQSLSIKQSASFDSTCLPLVITCNHSARIIYCQSHPTSGTSLFVPTIAMTFVHSLSPVNAWRCCRCPSWSSGPSLRGRGEKHTAQPVAVPLIPQSPVQSRSPK